MVSFAFGVGFVFAGVIIHWVWKVQLLLRGVWATLAVVGNGDNVNHIFQMSGYLELNGKKQGMIGGSREALEQEGYCFWAKVSQAEVMRFVSVGFNDPFAGGFLFGDCEEHIDVVKRDGRGRMVVETKGEEVVIGFPVTLPSKRGILLCKVSRSKDNRKWVHSFSVCI
jgi:hypothetical protein